MRVLLTGVFAHITWQFEVSRDRGPLDAVTEALESTRLVAVIILLELVIIILAVSSLSSFIDFALGQVVPDVVSLVHVSDTRW